MERKNSQEGITLVALVITIIVLIILAGVTIGTLVGDNGIIIKAQEGKQNMVNAAEEEKASLQNIENVINEIENGEIKEPEEPTDSTIESILKEEDCVWYTDANDTKQKCIVLYGPENENYGSYGIQMVTAYVIGDVTLGVSQDFEKSKEVYNNVVTTLNTAAESYRKKDDGIAELARCVGTIPDNPNYDEVEMYTSDDEYMKDYNNLFKGSDQKYEIDYNKMQQLGVEGNNYYWIASRYVLSSEVATNTYATSFNILTNDSLETSIYSTLCRVVDDGRTFAFAIERPRLRIVIRLKPGIKVISGDGSEANPYTLAP